MTSYDNVPGNYYDKHNTRNPIARVLMRGFYGALDGLVAQAAPARLYEAGCGEGELAIRLARAGYAIRGSDLEASVIGEANAAAVAAGLGERFAVADLMTLSGDDVDADMVLCCEVLEHLPAPEPALAHLATVTREWLLVSVPQEPLWRMLNLARARYVKDWGNTPGHIQHFSRRAIVDLVARHADVVAVRSPLPWTFVLARTRTPWPVVVAMR